MHHVGTQPLETPRLLLRRFTAQDGEAMYRNWASDPQVTKYLTWPVHVSAEASRIIAQEWEDSYADESVYQWAVVLKEKGEPIGSISVVSQRQDIGLVHIGYCIGAAWWGKGITAEALGAVLRFLFEQVGANKAESRHDPNNPNSGRVMQKCGMRFEGTLRACDRNNQGVCDAAYYGLLAEEYAAMQQEKAPAAPAET